MYTIRVGSGGFSISGGKLGGDPFFAYVTNTCDYLYNLMSKAPGAWVLEYGGPTRLHLFEITEASPAQEGVLITGIKEQVYYVLRTHLRMMQAGVNE